MPDSPPPYVAIAQRKRSERDSRIPAEWRLSEGILGTIPSNVMDVPARSGILTEREVEITEGKRWDGRALVRAMRNGELGVEEVVRAFCKVSAILFQRLS